MKKFAALFLCLMMILGTTSLAHAAPAVAEIGDWYTASDGVVNLSTKKDSANYAATVYAPLLDEDGDLITSYAIAKNVKAAITTYGMGGRENTSGVSIAAVSYEKWTKAGTKNDASGVAYFVALKLGGTRRAETDYASGTITVKQTGADGFSYPVEFAFALTVTTLKDSPTVGTSNRRYAFPVGDANHQFEMTGHPGKWFFIVDTISQGDLLFSATITANNTVWARYPDAYLEFFNGSGATFDKVGEMRISSDRGNYIYAVDRSNNLSEIPNLTYDGDTWSFPTRTLGAYVVSDIELDLTLQDVADEDDADSDADEAEGELNDETVQPADGDADKTNPGTGASA